MIVDVHYHLMPVVTEKLAVRTARYAMHAAGIVGKKITLEQIMKKALDTWADPAGERLIAYMDEAGIDLTVICMVDDAGNPRVKVESIQRGNKVVGDVALKYPGRVVALAGVDPRRPEAPDMLKQCFQEFGVRGLKYHPDYGYDPGGPESYKVLEVLAENQGILLTHTGSLMPPARNRFADPYKKSRIPKDPAFLYGIASFNFYLLPLGIFLLGYDNGQHAVPVSGINIFFVHLYRQTKTS